MKYVLLNMTRGALLAGLCAVVSVAWAETADEILRRDWLRQAERRFVDEPNLRAKAPAASASREADAAGAVDGVVNEPWGFHTDVGESPWWQVDLQALVKLDRVVIHNRGQGFQERAAALKVLVSQDGQSWQEAYGHDGRAFGCGGAALTAPCGGREARFVRVQVPGQSYLHLNEVQVYAAGGADNVALRRPALQSSVSQWSADHLRVAKGVAWAAVAGESLSRGEKLAAALRAAGVDVQPFEAEAKELRRKLAAAGEAPGGAAAGGGADEAQRELYVAVRQSVRALALRNPLLDFGRLLVTKQLDPGWIYHMSDQYLGWWSRPGGGIYALEDFKSGQPKETCLTGGFPEGCFQRPMLSWDAKRIVFAYCRFVPGLAENRDKVTKRALPEESFYHLYEMNADGTGLRQLTFGKYNDFDARYLPDGRIVFLSTRRGWQTRYTDDDVRQTVANAELPESYVRCGGDAYRPVAVYTLHTVKPDGSDMRTISPFEMFEWTPAVANDGSLIYARWDYIDRDNQPYMGLWRVNPDGTQPLHLFGNYTQNPNTMFEARPIPGSRKLIFTAGAHHANTGGSLVLLDVTRGEDGQEPMTRLTPEVPFPEFETTGEGGNWLRHYYASPWPLSETYYLAAWSHRGLLTHFHKNDEGNGMGVYLYDAFGNLDLLCADEKFQVLHPIPLRPQERPPVVASVLEPGAPKKGCFMLANVYNSRRPMPAGAKVARLRVVAVPPKTQPNMNVPEIGLTRDDPGKCVLGTVPVEADGSANFEAPSNVTLFFQALDEEGVVVQTMRSAVSLQAGQVWSCAGCHEAKDQNAGAASAPQPLAARRPPSPLAPEAEGSWPFRFDRLVQPVLAASCARCHTGEAGKPFAFPKEPKAAWKTLADAGKSPIRGLVKRQYASGESVPGTGIARQSALLPHLRTLKQKGEITADAFGRLVLWLDIYGQYEGHFNAGQEEELLALRAEWTAAGVVR
jgi:cytochrome c553